MTNADPEDVPTVASEGVTVEKSFEPNDFPVPAIAFAVRSEREVPVSVRLVDSVPEDVAPENIGFHPKYGAEFWSVDGEGIVFERELAPNEEYTTVYGLRGDDGEDPEKFLSEPTLESVAPPVEGASADDADSGGVVDGGTDDAEADDAEADDADSGGGEATERESEGEAREESDAVDGSDGPAIGTDDGADGSTGATQGDVETVSIGPDPGDAAVGVPGSSGGAGGESEASGNGDSPDTDSDPDVRGDGVAGEAASDGGDGDGSAAPAPASEGTVLETLADEIEAADPDDPGVAALRDALGVDLTRATVEARIEHLQSTVSDLEAYADALEEFLDENGNGQRVLADVREQYDETVARLDGVEATAEGADESVGALERRFDDEFEDIEAKIDGVRTDVEALESELESLSTEVSEVVEMRDRLASALGGLGAKPVDEGGDGEGGSS